jgi:hypothetical protein
VRYLRVLTNSAIASALLSAYLTIAALHLNPAFPLGSAAPLAAAFFLAYGANAVVVFYALVVLRQVAAVQMLSPGWLSVRVLGWMATMAATVGAGVLWLNAADFAPFLEADAARRISLAAVAVALCAAVCLVVAIAHVGRRGTWPSGVLLVTTMALSVVAPLLLRAAPRPPAAAAAAATATGPAAFGPDVAGRVVLIGLDGASLDYIRLAVAEGRLPNIARALDTGAATHLATLRPTQAEPIWATVATGRMPPTSGVRSAARYRSWLGGPSLEVLPDYVFSQALVRYGFLRAEPHTPSSMTSPAIWRILSDRGSAVGVVGFPLTHPAPPLRGYVVSDVLHRIDDARFALDGAAAVSPAALWTAVAEARSRPLTPDPHDVLARAGTLPAGPDADGRVAPSPVHADGLHLRLLDALEAGRPSRLAGVGLPGIDAVGHYFLRYASPSEFGDVSDAERVAFGSLMDDYYGVIDAAIGRILATMTADDLVLVVSSHGMEPLSPLKRVMERLVGDAQLSGTHERAPDGFMLAVGAAVQPGEPERGSVADIAPTVLYFLGLPIGRDMDGRARTDVFKAEFTASRPVTFIPSYGR